MIDNHVRDARETMHAYINFFQRIYYYYFH
jgi:hypothetical protein